MTFINSVLLRRPTHVGDMHLAHPSYRARSNRHAESTRSKQPDEFPFSGVVPIVYHEQEDDFGLLMMWEGLRLISQQDIVFTPDSIVAADFDVRCRPCRVPADELELGVCLCLCVLD